MQQTFRGDLIPETTNLSQRRKGKMKQQFRFLLAGVSLIGVLVCHATPAEAQVHTTTFQVTLVSLSITVTPPSITLGSKAAGATVRSVQGGSPAPFRVTNNSDIDAIVQIAGTNAKSTSVSADNPSWMLEITNGANMFRFAAGVAAGNDGPFTAVLEGPTSGDTTFGNAGPIVQVPGGPFGPGDSRTVSWELVLPNSSTKVGTQEFQILFQAASAT